MVRPGPWPEPPQPLPFPVVDNHAHLEFPAGDEPRTVTDRLDEAEAAGVRAVVQIGCDVESARWTVEQVQLDSRLVGGVALHPNDAARLVADGTYDEAFAEIASLATRDRIRVVGETGLDYFRTGPEGHDAQRRAFRDHIALAKELSLPLQIHDRDAHQDVIDVLVSDGAPEVTVFHCFSGDAQMARLCASHGWYLSFAGTVTFAGAHQLREAVAATDVGRILVETDAPFLTPHPHRGTPNAPAQVAHTTRSIAQVLGRDLSEVCQIIDATSQSLYGPW